MMQKSKRLTDKGRFWNKHIKRWQKTNISQSQYCNKQGLSIAAFRWWRRKLKDRIDQTESNVVPIKSGTTSFTEMPVPIKITSSNTAYDYEIGLPNQTRLRLRSNCDPQMVAELLALLEPTC